MAPPFGAQTKLYMNVESSPGTLATFSSSRGIRLFFNEFTVDERVDDFPLGFMPGSYYAGKFGEAPVAAYRQSGYTVRARVTLPKRCFGGYAMLDAAALGGLTTTSVGGGKYYHVAQPSMNFPALSLIAQTPIGDGTWSEFQFTGMRVAAMRLRHQIGDVIYQDVDLIGTGLTWSDTLSTVPATGNGFSPASTEAFAQWNGLHELVFNSVPGNRYLTIRGWEMTIDNQARQFYTVNGSQKPSPAYRGGPRIIKAYFDAEMDDKWEDFQSLFFGAGPDSGDTKFGITFSYKDPLDTYPVATLRRGFQWDGDFHHAQMRWNGVDGPGGQFARLAFQVLRGTTTSGMSLFTWNETSGPTGWDSYGNII